MCNQERFCSSVVDVVRATSCLLIGAIVALGSGCLKDVTGRPYGPGLGSGGSTGAAAETGGSDDLTTSISASDGASNDGSTGNSMPGDDNDGSDETSAGATSAEDGSTGGVDPTDPTDPTDGSGGSASTSGTTAGESSGSGGQTQGSPLHPQLDIAEGGEVCQTPGHLGECSGIATVCRFHDSDTGRCESCQECGNLNAFCGDGTQCDILFACFAGRCTNFCTLGTQECGAVDDCLDVGHPTRGVCDPYAL